MNFEEYRIIFIAGTLTLVLIANIPLISIVYNMSRGPQPFSELYALGPNHLIGSYPFNVAVGNKETVFVGVNNHLGYLAYYIVRVKFGNSTQPLPSESEPSSLPSLVEFNLFLKNNESWETPVNFTILEASFSKISSSVNLLKINDKTLKVNYNSNWDSSNRGFYYHLFFELWLYNDKSVRFEYNERFISIILNISA